MRPRARRLIASKLPDEWVHKRVEIVDVNDLLATISRLATTVFTTVFTKF